MSGRGSEGKGAGKGWNNNMSMDEMQAVMQMMMAKGKGGGRWGDSSADTSHKLHMWELEKKVYVEGLPDDANWQDLHKHFTDAGHKPALCEVMNGGKGVLAFKDASAATEAIAALDQTTMGGKTISTDVWTKKGNSEDQTEGRGKGGRPWNTSKWGDDSKSTLSKIRQTDDERKVYVEGLPAEATWKGLEIHFAAAGHKPGLCEVMNGGRGVLLFRDAAAATEAIAALDQTTMGGNTITTDVWNSGGGGWGNSNGNGQGWGSNTNSNMNPMQAMMMAMMMKGNSGGKGSGWGGTGGNQRAQDLGATCVISNIPDGVPLDEFQGNLEQAGTVKKAQFIGGGRAMVSFANAAEANQCVTMFHGCDIGGAKLQVHLGKGGGLESNFGGSGRGLGGMGGNQPSKDLGATCVISNIPDVITLEEFQENLGQAGNVKKAKFTGGGRAIVSFATVEEANKCVAMFNGCDVGGAKLQVYLGKQ